jgi:diaminopimelate epimerase
MKYTKYHALGNDYIIIAPADAPNGLSADAIRTICHRNFGPGSDGILFGPLPGDGSDFGLRIFNPDGSEAEKSGNGLRIFARHLYDSNLVLFESFSVDTLGGNVRCQVHPSTREVTVQMGGISFKSRQIPVTGSDREVINEILTIDGSDLTFCAATVGNPHCVVLVDDPTEAMARRWGPGIETEPRFPNRTNVQFMKVLDRHNIQIEIWERGAGYTLASGSSSCAAAGVARELGLCDNHITVHMPGGQLAIAFEADNTATLTGPVTKVCLGLIADEAFHNSEE